MTSTTGVASRQLQECKVDGRSPSTTTELRPTAARNCTPSRDAFAQCTPVTQQVTTVETRGLHFSAELVMTPHQPPPVAINRPPQHRMDVAPPALLICSCNCSVCTTLSPLCVAVEMGPNLPAELVMATGLSLHCDGQNSSAARTDRCPSSSCAELQLRLFSAYAVLPVLLLHSRNRTEFTSRTGYRIPPTSSSFSCATQNGCPFSRSMEMHL